MGYNTVVLIRNDGLDEIEKHPEQFVAGILAKMDYMGGEFRVGNHGNPAEVMPTAHADVFRLYATHGNSILGLSEHDGLVGKTLDLYRRGGSYARFIREMVNRAEQSLLRLRSKLDAIDAEHGA